MKLWWHEWKFGGTRKAVETRESSENLLCFLRVMGKWLPSNQLRACSIFGFCFDHVDYNRKMESIFQYAFRNYILYRKILIISLGLIFVQKTLFAGLIFAGAYFGRGLLLEGILRFKMGLACQ